MRQVGQHLTRNVLGSAGSTDRAQSSDADHDASDGENDDNDDRIDTQELLIETAWSIGIFALKSIVLTLFVNSIRDRFRVNGEPIVSKWSVTNSMAVLLIWEMRDLDLVLACSCRECAGHGSRRTNDHGRV